jgi:hypothetical protein
VKLKPKEKELKPAHLRLKLPGQLNEDLAAYAEFYQVSYKEPIEHPELVLLMIEHFITTDAEFKRWRNGKEDDAQPVKPNGGSRPSFQQATQDRPNEQP